MKFLYNSKTKRIKVLEPGAKQIRLTNLECKFLEVLSNGCLNTWREIGEYVYGCYDKYVYDCLGYVKKSLLTKVKLNIKNCTRVRAYING